LGIVIIAGDAETDAFLALGSGLIALGTGALVSFAFFFLSSFRILLSFLHETLPEGAANKGGEGSGVRSL